MKAQPNRRAVFVRSIIDRDWPVVFALLGLSKGKCKRCKEPIWWFQTANGNWVPLGTEGREHKKQCTMAQAGKGMKL